MNRDQSLPISSTIQVKNRAWSPSLPFPPPSRFYIVLYCTVLYCTLHLWIVHSPKVHLCGRVSRAAESECRPLLSLLAATPTLLCRQPMTAPDDAPKVVFTHSRLHMAARLENTFERDFLFQKNGRCGMGWDSVSSLQSLCCNTGKNYDENKSTKYIAWMQCNIPNFCKCIKCICI